MNPQGQQFKNMDITKLLNLQGMGEIDPTILNTPNTPATNSNAEQEIAKGKKQTMGEEVATKTKVPLVSVTKRKRKRSSSDKAASSGNATKKKVSLVEAIQKPTPTLEELKSLEEERKRKRSGKPNTKKACYHCKKSHSCCSNEKPCPRCIQRGLVCMTEDEYKEAERIKMMRKKQISANIRNRKMVDGKVVMTPQSEPLSLIDFAKQKYFEGSHIQEVPVLNQQMSATKTNYESMLQDIRPAMRRRPNPSQDDIATEYLHSNVTPTFQTPALMPQGNFMQGANANVVRNLTEVMNQQKRVIKHLLDSKATEPFQNPYTEYYLTGTPVSMWKFNGIGRPRELLSCNDAFANMLHCESFRELMSESYQHEGIHIVLANCNVDPTATPMADLLTLSQGIAIILHGILRHIQVNPQFDVLDQIRYMTNKSRIYGRILFNRIMFENGIMYMSHHEIDKWDNSISINDQSFPATVEADSGYSASDQEKVYDTYHQFLSHFQDFMKIQMNKQLNKKNNEK